MSKGEKQDYKAVVFDLDGTIFEKPWESSPKDGVAVSCWDALFDTLGIRDVHERIKEIFLRNGFKSYIEWADVCCCVLKAKELTKQTFQKVINERPLMKGAVETFEVLRESNVTTAVVTGSFEELALRAKKELGIHHVMAHCRLIFDEAGYLKDWKIFATDWKDKLKFVKYLADVNKISLQECAYVGDDVNDVPVFKKVGLAIAFNCNKRVVMENAHVVIKEKDLRKILPYLGLPLSKSKR